MGIDFSIDRPLVFLTGKGGVGKTTVAAALGLAVARRGRRTVVCEVAAQQRIPALFGVEGAGAGAGPAEVEVADGLWATSVDPEDALREWLAEQLRSRSLVQALTRSNAFQYFVAAAPGARELVTVTKLWELAQERRWDKRAEGYDVVVADLPASGHGLGLLRTARTFADIARVGPIAAQAGRVAQAVEDPGRSAVLAVTLPGELPVSETLELDRRAREALGRGLDGVVCNAVLPRRFTAADVAAVDRVAVPVATRAVHAEHGRAAVHHAQLRRLRRGATAPVLTLPHVPSETLRREDVEDLADELGRHLR